MSACLKLLDGLGLKNTYDLVEGHPIVGKVVHSLLILGFYHNHDTASEIVKVKTTDGFIEFRHYPLRKPVQPEVPSGFWLRLFEMVAGRAA
jgi:hypothetical protein